MAKNITINIDNTTIFKVIVATVLFILTFRFLQAVSYGLTLIGISAFLALALNPPVSYLSARITRGISAAATGIAYLFVLTIIGGFLWALVPPLVNQTGDFLDNLPQYVENISQGDNFVSDFVNRYDLDTEIKEFGDNLGDRLGDTSGPIFSGINIIGAALVSLLTVLVLTFFMLIEGPAWLDKFWKLQPASKRKHRQQLAQKMYSVITGYVNGQLVIALFASFMSLIAMLIVGIPYALPLAGVVGLFGLIPLVGATLASLLVIVVALFQSAYSAIAMLVFFLIYQQVENNVIQPYIQSRTLDVSPLLVLVAVLFGISIGGILGGFVAIPVAAITKILITDYYAKR